MICKRLIGLVKDWYLNVQEETMAPARMVSFMEQHINQCEVCMGDPDIQVEFEKIRDIVLPASKIPKKQRKKEKIPTEKPTEQEVVDKGNKGDKSGEEENNDGDAGSG